jgi:hypothetical protein
MASVHPLAGTELRALRRLQREQEPTRYVFMSERGAPMSAVGLRRMIGRLGVTAKMPFPVHPRMLRHACGFAARQISAGDGFIPPAQKRNRPAIGVTQSQKPPSGSFAEPKLMPIRIDFSRFSRQAGEESCSFTGYRFCGEHWLPATV